MPLVTLCVSVCIDLVMKLRPIVIIYNTKNNYEDHDIECSYNASLNLKISLDVGPLLKEESASLTLLPLRESITKVPNYGDILESTIRILPGHEYVQCRLFDDNDLQVASATTRIRKNSFDENISKSRECIYTVYLKLAKCLFYVRNSVFRASKFLRTTEKQTHWSVCIVLKC